MQDAGCFLCFVSFDLCKIGSLIPILFFIYLFIFVGLGFELHKCFTFAKQALCHLSVSPVHFALAILEMEGS
jgi:hypothetical protein